MICIYICNIYIYCESCIMASSMIGSFIRLVRCEQTHMDNLQARLAQGAHFRAGGSLVTKCLAISFRVRSLSFGQGP